MAHQPPETLREVQDLLAEEVELHVPADDRHADVVGRERRAHVETEHRDLETDEGEGHAQREHQEHRGQIDREPQHQHGQLEPATRDAAVLPQALHGLEVQVDALEQQQREEEQPLPPGEPGLEPAPGGGTLLLEGEGVDLDVGVLAHLVRVPVVAGVLVHPPRVAHPDADDRQEPAEAIVGRSRGQHLPVRGLVPDEGQLGEQDPERRGHQQLEPGVVEQDDAGDDATEGEHRDRSGARRRTTGSATADPCHGRPEPERCRTESPGWVCVLARLGARTVIVRSDRSGPRGTARLPSRLTRQRTGRDPTSMPLTMIRDYPGPAP